MRLGERLALEVLERPGLHLGDPVFEVLLAHPEAAQGGLDGADDVCVMNQMGAGDCLLATVEHAHAARRQ